MALPQLDFRRVQNQKPDRPKQYSPSWQTTLGLAITSTILLVGCAGEVVENSTSTTEVPDSVQRAFAAAHPGVSPAWEKQVYGYEAEFVKDGIEYEVEFSEDGQWLETEYEVTQDYQFSLLVLDKVKREHPGWAITKREVEITPQGKFYEVEIEQGGQQIELYFDERGNKAQNSHEDA
ncbi:PepSY-like domain-containing protein [Tychonema sp. BBK16]|uniref:PepSY-like domain-containing protein n=1 Tax=Tychonema sp. BBK16 TaxID=2699888 RepID=UPI001F1DC70D|nr:PepSY-like domain-containing protein [Tychonema sp. BBK16]MCF6372932.1 PepSY-like domain-containing protein [Tychonema sp. BBK16]